MLIAFQSYEKGCRNDFVSWRKDGGKPKGVFFLKMKVLRTKGKLSEAEARVNLRHCYSAAAAIWQFRF